jgi:outer membrane immunogenic protein
MRRISAVLLTTIGLGLAGLQPGLAADLATKGPIAAPPLTTPVSAYNWTGFYVGLNVGAGWGTTEATALLSTAVLGVPGGFNLPISSHNFNGFLGGFEAGYNWQTGIFVLGVEGDFDFADLQGNTPCLVVFNCTVHHHWVADITGRVGVVAFDQALVYLKGGAAWANAQYGFGNTFAGVAVSGSANTTRVGGLLGIGVEYAFLPRWSAKVEYNFIGFGNQTVNVPVTVGGLGTVVFPTQINESMHIVKAGVNYRFW